MSTIEIEINDQLLLKLALVAHSRDITLNKLLSEIIEKHFTKFEQGDNNGTKDNPAS